MTLRRKLSFNLFFLFAVIALLAVVGSYYLSLLASVSTEVTTDNYRTLHYVQEMNTLLARIDYAAARPPGAGTRPALRSDFDSLESWLARQEQNITEPGEREMTARLRDGIALLRRAALAAAADSSGTDLSAKNLREVDSLLYEVRGLLERIHTANSRGVLRKNSRATQTAREVILSMSLFGTGGIIIGWIFMITLPGIISRPINRLNEGLAEITAGNYDLNIPANDIAEFDNLTATFNRMAAKLKEYEQTNFAAVLTQKRRLDMMINRMSEGVIGVGIDHRVIFANDLALRLLDMKGEEVIGARTGELAQRNMLFAEMLNRVGKAGKGEEGGQGGYLKIVLDGRARMYAQTILLLPVESFGEEESRGEKVIVLSDITTFAEKDSAKTKLIATLSHELKTPASVIDMCADLMENPQVGSLNDEQREYLATIRGNTLRIRRLIADMTDLTKAESGVMEMRMEAVHPASLVEKGLEGVELLLNEKKIATRIDIEPDLPAVNADVNKAVRALNNLLVNAIRYSPPEGTITIEGRNVSGGVALSVSDQGPGLTADAAGHLFERYARFGDTSREGTGLGLAIVSEFMEGMGGSVEADTAPGAGSRFTLTFRSAQSSASEDRPPS